jgi:hypothetical protein
MTAFKFSRGRHWESYDVIVDGKVIGVVCKHEHHGHEVNWSLYIIDQDGYNGPNHGWFATRKDAAEALIEEAV